MARGLSAATAVVLHAACLAAATAPALAAVAPGCPRLPLSPPSLEKVSVTAAWRTNVSAALQAANTALKAFAAGSPGCGAQLVVTLGGELAHQASAGCAVAAPASAGRGRRAPLHNGWTSPRSPWQRRGRDGDGATAGGSAGCREVPDFNTTVWRIGSVTKVFTAMLLMRAADQGEVRLDDKLSAVIPGFAAAPSVTLRSVAAQLGGLVREVPLPCRGDESDCNLTTAQLLPMINAQGVLWPPDVRPSYSNLGYSLLGRAIAPGFPPAPGAYEQRVATELLAPLGMLGSGFGLANGTAARSRLATGATPDVEPADLGWANPNGGMYATGADMVSFLGFLGSGGQTAAGVLSAEAVREWMLPRFMQPDGVSGFGMPWEVELGPGGWLLTKAGNIDQFGSQLIHSQSSRLGVWLAVNTPGPAATDLAASVSGCLVAAVNQAVAEAAAAAAPLPTRAHDFVGVFDGYVPVLLTNMTINITLEGGGGGGNAELWATMAWSTGGGVAAVRRRPTDGAAVLEMPDSLPIPCLLVAELGWDGAVLQLAGDGASVTLPSLLPGAFFWRVG